MLLYFYKTFLKQSYMKKFILIINCPMDSGSSTLIRLLMRKIENTFKVSTNTIKFSISDYQPDRDRPTVHKATIAMAKQMLQDGYSLIVEGGSLSQEEFNKNLVVDLDPEIVIQTINLEAPREILYDRFKQRVNKSQVDNKKISIFDDAGFEERYEAYLKIRNQGERTYDSNQLTYEMISASVLEFLRLSTLQ